MGRSEVPFSERAGYASLDGCLGRGSEVRARGLGPGRRGEAKGFPGHANSRQAVLELIL
jgi:hypothetical protein